jgi:Leucine-rich repeat (LRR) protein
MTNQDESIQPNEVLAETKELTADMVSKGLRTLGIHPLTQKHTLLELFLPQLQLSSIDILKNYPLVVYLDISDNKLTSLNPLENMTALIHLKAR